MRTYKLRADRLKEPQTEKPFWIKINPETMKLLADLHDHGKGDRYWRLFQFAKISRKDFRKSRSQGSHQSSQCSD